MRRRGPVFIAGLIGAGFTKDQITYRKNVRDKWPENSFKSSTVSVLQQSVNMHLCETETGLGGYLFREIRRPGKDGHQTSIVTTHPTLATNLIAGRMFARWCRENFFRYLDYGL